MIPAFPFMTSSEHFVTFAILCLDNSLLGRPSCVQQVERADSEGRDTHVTTLEIFKDA